MKVAKLEWTHIEKMTRVLAQKVNAVLGTNFDMLVVPRGGLCVGAILAHELKWRGTICTTQDKVIPAWHETLLIVDDICDNGDRLRKERSYVETPKRQVYTATLIVRKTCQEQWPEFYALTWPGPEYIVFPWERDAPNTQRDDAASQTQSQPPESPQASPEAQGPAATPAP